VTALGRLLDLPRRFLVSWRDFGPRFTLYHLVSDWLLPKRLLQFGRIVVWARLLDAHSTAPVDPDVQLAPDDRAALLAEMPAVERAYWGGLCAGDAAVWTLREDGRLIAFAALRPGERRHPDWLLHRGRPGDIWGSGVWVHPDRRGAGLANRVRDAAAAALAQSGYTRRVGIVEVANRSSIRSAQKGLYTSLATIAYLRVLDFAVVRAGHRWFYGRCDADRPLHVPIDAYDGAG
jgi:GNAT superfamily N-acetyltransferase